MKPRKVLETKVHVSLCVEKLVLYLVIALLALLGR